MSRVVPTPEELHERIEQIRKEIAEVKPSHTVATATIVAKQSELFVAAAQLADLASRRLERQTDTLIDLTRSLKIFTVIVAVLTAGLFVIEAFHIFERRQASIQHAQQKQFSNQAAQKEAHD